MKKILGLLLCLCMLLSLSACFFDNSDKETSDTPDTEDNTEILTLFENGASQYEIIYSENATDVDANFVVMLNEYIHKLTGIRLATNDDFIRAGESNDGKTCKILVGATNYKLSDEAMAEIMYQDYQIIACDTNIAIGAYTASGYDGALKWLKNNVFNNYSDGNLSMRAVTVQESLVSGYPISDWTIAGNSLKKYSIVYADEELVDEAKELQLLLAKKAGWYLKTGLASQMPESEYEILIGETGRTASESVQKPAALNYTLQVVDNALVIKTGGAHSSIRFWDNFFDIVVGDAEKVDMSEMYLLDGNFFDDPNNSSLAKGADLRIMTANLMANLKDYDSGAAASGFAFERRAELFLASVDYYEPTVIGIQEADQSWYDAIEAYEFTEDWELLKFENSKMKNEYVFSTIMYRSDLYNLLESGTKHYSKDNNARCRVLTWAKFEDKITKKKFCIVSTHWDGKDTANTLTQSAELAEFVNQQTVPTFTMGDYNSNEWTQAYSGFLTASNSIDCMKNCDDFSKTDNSKRVNIEDSWHDWGKLDTAVGGSADHITATKSNSEVLKFETLIYNDQEWASDHAWLYVDIKLK